MILSTINLTTRAKLPGEYNEDLAPYHGRALVVPFDKVDLYGYTYDRSTVEHLDGFRSDLRLNHESERIGIADWDVQPDGLYANFQVDEWFTDIRELVATNAIREVSIGFYARMLSEDLSTGTIKPDKIYISELSLLTPDNEAGIPEANIVQFRNKEKNNMEEIEKFMQERSIDLDALAAMLNGKEERDAENAALKEAIDASAQERAAWVEQVETMQARLKEIDEAEKRKKEDRKMENKNYLSTRQASNDFIVTLGEARSFKEAQANWFANLQKRDAMSEADWSLAIPEPIVTNIKQAFEDYTGVLSYFPFIGGVLGTEIEFSTTKNEASGRASRDSEKSESEYTAYTYSIGVSELYSLVKFSYLDRLKDTAAGSLNFNYIMTDLAKTLVRHAEKAILIGVADMPNVKSIVGETDPNLVTNVTGIDFDAASYNATFLDSLSANLDLVLAEGNIVIFTSKAIARKVANAKDGDGTYLNPAAAFSQIKGGENQIWGYTFFATDLLPAETPFVAVAEGAYKPVGLDPRVPEQLMQFDISYNKDAYEARGAFGGQLGEYKGAVVFTNTPAK
jgi:HK97 family phage major capsid protein